MNSLKTLITRDLKGLTYESGKYFYNCQYCWCEMEVKEVVTAFHDSETKVGYFIHNCIGCKCNSIVKVKKKQ